MSTRTSAVPALVFALSALAQGCGDPAEPPVDGGPPTFENVQAIFTRSCAQFDSCHSATGARGNLALAAGVSYASLVGRPSDEVPRVMRVVPGDPAASYLMIKLDGTMHTLPECQSAAGRMTCGVQMPEADEALHPNVRNAIREWIRLGAMGPRDR